MSLEPLAVNKLSQRYWTPFEMHKHSATLVTLTENIGLVHNHLTRLWQRSHASIALPMTLQASNHVQQFRLQDVTACNKHIQNAAAHLIAK